MIGVHLIFSSAISDVEIAEGLKNFCTSRGIDTFSGNQIFQDAALVWLSLSTLDDLGYEDNAIGEIKDILTLAPVSFLLLEFNDEPEAMSLALGLVKELSAHWVLVLDDCNGGYYTRKGICELVERGFI